MILMLIIASTFIISLISFIGALALVFNEKILNKILLVLVALSAGGLLGGAFLHLLPESIEKADGSISVYIYLIVGFCLFFILEQFLRWHHCHKTEHKKEYAKRPISYLILLSDGVHNFIDGLIIAASFIISLPLGIATSIAVVLHEIPQEFGDFGVLVYGGFKPKKALWFNFLSGSVAVAGGIVGFYLVGSIEQFAIFLLPFAAGNFIYIACSDLIPEIQHKDHLGRSLLYFLVFLVGIALMFGLRVMG